MMGATARKKHCRQNGSDSMERIFTERAHLMCPKMNFGIAIHINRDLEKDRVMDSFNTLAEDHPFLRAVLGYDQKENGYYYDISDSSAIAVMISDETLTGIDDPKLIRTYEQLTGYDWDIREEGMLKAVAWSCGDSTVFLLVFHHLLADGRGALNLALELSDLYAEGKRHGAVNEQLITLSDLPKGSELTSVSKVLVKKANKDWEKEANEPLSYPQYHEFADRFVKNDKTEVEMIRTPASGVSEMRSGCREHSVTINDLLMAKMYREDKTDKIIIAKDLREELPCFNENALGNYSTAFSVVIKKQSDDIWKLAEEVHKKVQKTLSNPRDVYLILQCYANLKPELLDAAFLAAKGAYPSKSAAFIGKTFLGFETPSGYSITNLGKIENRNLRSACFIPPASPAIRKTIGVITVNGEMVSCAHFREQE